MAESQCLSNCRFSTLPAPTPPKHHACVHPQWGGDNSEMDCGTLDLLALFIFNLAGY